MSVDLSHLPSKLTLHRGERTDLELPSYGGSGNYWSAQPVAGEEVASVSVATAAAEAPRPERGAEPPAAAPVPERAVIEGVLPGRARCRLILGRSFEEGAPTAEHEIEIEVVEDPSPG